MTRTIAGIIAILFMIVVAWYITTCGVGKVFVTIVHTARRENAAAARNRTALRVVPIEHFTNKILIGAITALVSFATNAIMTSIGCVNVTSATKLPALTASRNSLDQ